MMNSKTSALIFFFIISLGITISSNEFQKTIGLLDYNIFENIY